MSSLYSAARPDLITLAIPYQTKIPLFPEDSRNSETIDIAVASEFKDYAFPAAAIDASHKVVVSLDGNHEPMIFSIGTDSRLYCIRHVSGDAWKLYDITPGGVNTSVSMFDVTQHRTTRKVAICAVVPVSGSSYPDLYYCKPLDVTVQAFSLPNSINYDRLSNEKQCKIAAVTITPADTDMTKCEIMVGTGETDVNRAVNYIVLPDLSTPTWTLVSIPTDASKVIKVLPAMLKNPIGSCAISLFRKSSTASDIPANVGTFISCDSLDGKYHIKVYLDKVGGGARTMSTVVNAKGLSDLYVAGLKGIGYYANRRIEQDPVVLLPDIEFKDLAAMESNLKIGILAVAANGMLYYIEGERAKEGQIIPTFNTSMYPIRKDVGTLSTQYNAGINAYEVVYVDFNGQLKHLWRDPSTKMWFEQAIYVPMTGRICQFTAFVSQVRLQGSAGSSITGRHKILLSASEVAYVLVNEKPFRLDKTPVAFQSDSSGRLCIVVQARVQLAAPRISAILKEGTTEYSFIIEPGHRLLRQWAKVRTGSDLKNAKSTDGKKVFSNTRIDDATFDTVADIVKHVPDMVDALDTSASSMLGLESRTFKKNVSVSSERIGVAFRTSSSHDWMDDAANVTSSIGDFLETIWHGLLQVAKFGVKIAAGVVDFFAEIAGKAYRWTLNTNGTLIRSVATFLKETLGIDITRFIALFGFVWDYDNLLLTQKIIVRSIKEGVVVLSDLLQQSSLPSKALIANLRDVVSHAIPQSGSEKEKGPDVLALAADLLKDSFFAKSLRQIFDNPIIHEVRRYISLWLAEVAAVVGEVIDISGLADLQKLLAGKLSELLQKISADASKDFSTLLRDIFNALVDVLTGKSDLSAVLNILFSDAFWLFFDTLEDVILFLIDLIPQLVTCGFKVLSSRIKMPGISVFWESFTQTPFSFVDVGSMIIAQILYLTTMMWKESLPFDVMTPWYDLLPKDSKDTKYKPMLRKFGRNPFPGPVVLAAADSSIESAPGISDLAFWDLVFGFLTSVGTCGASICVLGTAVASKPYPEGYQRVPNSLNQSSNQELVKPTPSGLLFLEKGEVIFTIFGLLAEAATFVIAFHNYHQDSDVAEFVPLYTKFTALFLKGIGLIASISGYGPIGSQFFPPIANLINSSVPGTIDWIASEKQLSDRVGATANALNFLGGLCDIGTIVLGDAGQEEIQWVPFGVSSYANVMQAIMVLSYGFKWGSFGKKN